MKTKWILAASVIGFGTSVALALSNTAGAMPADTSGTAADVAHGKRVFIATGCYQCHGYAGQGAQSTGPALVPLRLGEEAFVGYLRAPGGVMPAFSARILPDADAHDVSAYVRSLSPGRPPERIALLAPYVVRSATPRAAAVATPAAAAPAPVAATALAEGGKLYATNCAMCHGAQLEGGIGPDLRTQGAKRSVEQIAAIILHPPAGMPKLSPVPLVAAQVTQVAAFVHEKH